MKKTQKNTLGQRDYFLNMSFAAAMELAVGRSPLSREDVAFRMGWSPSFAGRIFNPSENYWPSVLSIPQLCATLGNTDLIDWLQVQAAALMEGQFCSNSHLRKEGPLLRHMTSIGAELGDMLHEVEAAVEGDGNVDGTEAKRIIREARGMLQKLDELVGAMTAIREEERDA